VGKKSDNARVLVNDDIIVIDFWLLLVHGNFSGFLNEKVVKSELELISESLQEIEKLNSNQRVVSFLKKLNVGL